LCELKVHSFSSLTADCFNSPVVWKMVGIYRKLSNLHALKMFHMYGISSKELYINTFLSEQEEKSCSNSTNRTDKFPASCILLQFLLSIVFVKYFWGGGEGVGCFVLYHFRWHSYPVPQFGEWVKQRSVHSW
jgi:hypothetical protein